MADIKQRITIGFHGQAVAARVAPDALKEFRKALEGSKGTADWFELEAEDGTIALDLAKVVFVQVDAGDQRVGFGA
jgi:hypothetical protein